MTARPPHRPITRLLIANRGEIARRIIRTAHRMGIKTVAVYSDADASAPHVREATTARHLGPPPARESYLDPAKVLAAAKDAGADAIHPGYGFLSENAQFAQAVIDAGMIWVGPPPSAIRAMGLKHAAKKLMSEAGVPTTPGYLGDDQSDQRLQAEADRITYPVLIKAVAGGGGKGMRKVEAREDFAAALAACKREASASFGDDRVLLETYVTRPRHIEVQVFADQYGDAVHLFERDCSLQRRHQKVIEEAPAPGMDEATRAAVTSAAVKAAKAVGYQGAGTIEFIADGSGPLRADRIWFMEMNTRLQVEHPVTEMITGLDLVEWQIRIAQGEPLPLPQSAITRSGHAMEARLYAENPLSGFLPSTGPLDHFRLPAPHVARVDAGVEEGGEVSPFYDPMIAKIIVHADTREAAARQLEIACAEVEVWPVKTNAGFLARCAGHPDFIAARIDTSFIDSRLDALTLAPDAPADVLQSAARLLMAGGERGERPSAPSPWSPSLGAFGFRLNGPPAALTCLTVGSAVVRIEMDPKARAPSNGYVRTEEGAVLFKRGEAYSVSMPDYSAGAAAAASSGVLVSPMPGRIVSVGAETGAAVAKGQPIVTLEAMKMEHALTAPFAGILSALSVKPGDQVAEGVVLARIEEQA
jgi:propionyl-CoA carboxylase alpha chain/3-methylcrotonyl-CoA carboxylase alpha subunit